MKHRVGTKNVNHTLNSVYESGKYELNQITAADWTSAIRLATRQEALYAKVDQLDPPSEPIEGGEPIPDFQEPLPDNSNEFIVTPQKALKCTNCNFESLQQCSLKRHLNSFVQCSICSKIFCGRRAKAQHKSHQLKEHKIKDKRNETFKPKKVHTCDHCKKTFKYPSLLKHHLTMSKCGRL